METENFSLPKKKKLERKNFEKVLIAGIRGQLNGQGQKKIDKSDNIIELASMKNTKNTLLFHVQKQQHLFLNISNQNEDGTTILCKFLLQNIHTFDEMKLTGNCLKWSRPFLIFSDEFQDEENHPQLILLRNLFEKIFGTPRNHLKSQPFHDHCISFTFVNNYVYFRMYQIVSTESGVVNEIGPRFSMRLRKILSDSLPIFVDDSFHYPIVKRKELRDKHKFNYQIKKINRKIRDRDENFLKKYSVDSDITHNILKK
ncbi:hypothetical protein SNEBB_004948 [Seison nebaliae]|nr:hypothetical protein SNEBB_004948 [Seison nebaliae]